MKIQRLLFATSYLLGVFLLVSCTEERRVERHGPKHEEKKESSGHGHEHHHDGWSLPHMVEIFEMPLAEKAGHCLEEGFKYIGHQTEMFEPCASAHLGHLPEPSHVKFNHWHKKWDHKEIDLMFDGEIMLCKFRAKELNETLTKMKEAAGNMRFLLVNNDEGSHWERNHDILMMKINEDEVVMGLYDKNYLKY